MRQVQATPKSISSQLFMTRRKAIDKLQISMKTFRRLCILKGIHPRDPKNKKAASGGSGVPKIFYLTKDIRAIASDPILKTLRYKKSLLRKYTKAVNKKERVNAESLKERFPRYSLDHTVKDRFPTFIDALRELDDALCMIFLYAVTPPADRVSKHAVEHCKQLSYEFMHYVIQTRSLRKVFLSIKGIYYQASIHGQDITWLVPYPFAQPVPAMVDLTVMKNFLEFYRVHIGFVNYKLFSEINLQYPPTIDMASASGGNGLNSLVFKSNLDESVKISSDQSASAKKKINALNPELQERIRNIDQKLDSMDDSAQQNNEEMEEDMVDGNQDEVELDTFEPVAGEDRDGDTEEVLESLKNKTTLTSFQSLFVGQNFFLSREVPRYSLEFIIRSFGGNVGWDATIATGSPYNMSSPKVTYIITDRPVILNRRTDCMYVQPQWVYDSINAKKMINEGPYGPGLKLPPHLSPFVVYKEGDYVPDEAYKFEGEIQGDLPEKNEEVKEDEPASDDSEDESDEGFGEEVSDNESTQAETIEDKPSSKSKGQLGGKNKIKQNNTNNKKVVAKSKKQLKSKNKGDQDNAAKKKPVAKTKKQLSISAEKKEATDLNEMAKSMMNMKDRNLYKKIQSSADSKKRKVNRLERKKKALKEKKEAAEKQIQVRKSLEKHNIIATSKKN